MNFFDLTAEEAEAYCVQVAADGPARLDELALRLTADGVPLDQFDATIPSLVPLWVWYLKFARADFPGIPADAEPRLAVELQRSANFRACYAAELLTHYLIEVARTCFTGVGWVVNPNRGTGDYRRTAVRYIDDDGSRGLSHLDQHTKGVTLVLQQGKAEYVDPNFLANRFLAGPFLCGRTTAARCRNIPRGQSILVGLTGDEAPRQAGPLQGVLPSIIVEDEPEDEEGNDVDGNKVDDDGEEVGDELVFAHLSADMEDLDTAPPLDVDVILPVLIELRFRAPDGTEPTAAIILGEEFTEFIRRNDAMITTLVADGRLRALQIASISPTQASWTKITDRFLRIAKPLTARLAPEGEFSNPPLCSSRH